MFCVIQSIALKKQQTGYPKRLLSEWLSYSIAGTDMSYYYHNQSLECFLRPIRQAFRISIHESFRAAGTVKKRQFPICTVNYYDLATDFFSLFEWGDTKIHQAAEALEVSEERLYCLIEAKLTPLQERIQAEFAQTENFRSMRNKCGFWTPTPQRRPRFARSMNDKGKNTAVGTSKTFKITTATRAEPGVPKD